MNNGRARKLGMALAIVIGGLLMAGSGKQLFGVRAAGQQAGQVGGQDREFHQTYDLAPNGTVGIFNTSGNIRVTTWPAGSNENRVKVDAVKHSRREEDYARVRVEVNATPNRVEIRAVYPSAVNWRGGGVSVDFDVKMPRTAAINPANSSSGDVTVTGPIERVAARTSSGNLTVSDVKDTANLSTSSGNVQATHISGELREIGRASCRERVLRVV